MFLCSAFFALFLVFCIVILSSHFVRHRQFRCGHKTAKRERSKWKEIGKRVNVRCSNTLLRSLFIIEFICCYFLIWNAQTNDRLKNTRELMSFFCFRLLPLLSVYLLDYLFTLLFSFQFDQMWATATSLLTHLLCWKKRREKKRRKTRQKRMNKKTICTNTFGRLFFSQRLLHFFCSCVLFFIRCYIQYTHRFDSHLRCDEYFTWLSTIILLRTDAMIFLVLAFTSH